MFSCASPAFLLLRFYLPFCSPSHSVVFTNFKSEINEEIAYHLEEFFKYRLPAKSGIIHLHHIVINSSHPLRSISPTSDSTVLVDLFYFLDFYSYLCFLYSPPPLLPIFVTPSLFLYRSYFCLPIIRKLILYNIISSSRPSPYSLFYHHSYHPYSLKYYIYTHYFTKH